MRESSTLTWSEAFLLKRPRIGSKYVDPTKSREPDRYVSAWVPVWCHEFIALPFLRPDPFSVSSTHILDFILLYSHPHSVGRVLTCFSDLRLQPGVLRVLANQLLNGLTIVLTIAIIISAVTKQWIEVGTWRWCRVVRAELGKEISCRSANRRVSGARPLWRNTIPYKILIIFRLLFRCTSICRIHQHGGRVPSGVEVGAHDGVAPLHVRPFCSST